MKKKATEQITENKSKMDKAKEIVGFLSEVVTLVGAVVALGIMPQKDDK